MTRFERLLNKRIKLIVENVATSSEMVKDIYSRSYDRQEAEDLLYHTIGPLTDKPRWVNKEWAGTGAPPEDYAPGGPAPRWSPEEVIYAVAGNPSKLFRGGSDAPGYGRMGGAPLYRTAMKIARKFKKDKDKSFIEDLYSNGLVPLTRMMKPGFDEGRSPFISYIMRTIEGAIENGPGASSEAQAVTSDDRATQQLGLAAAIKVTDPNVIRQAANKVKGKYQTERSHDKHPDNPFGSYSSQYYQTMTAYADALESGDENKIDSARSRLVQLKNDIDDVNQTIRGASSGLGQAISNKDRGAVTGDAVNLRTTRMILAKILKSGFESINTDDSKKISQALKSIQSNTATLEKKKPETLEHEDKKRLSDLRTYNNLINGAVEAINSGSLSAIKNSYKDLSEAMKMHQESKKFGVASMDAKMGSDDDGADLKSTLKGSDPSSEKSEVKANQEVIKYLLDLAIKYDLNSLLSKDSKYRAYAADAKGGELGGKMTVNEFRYIIRSLGPSASDYPGKGVMRKNISKPRDSVGWWSPGEDPEIEPLPSGEGQWNSIWVREGYQSLGPTEISDEITKEVEEFNSLGIKTARAVKVDSKGEKSVASKVAISNAIRSAKAKLMVLRGIYKEELGLGESVDGRIPLELFTDKIDREIVVETVDYMISKVNAILLEEAPAGWKGTIEAMKKHKDKFSTDPDSGKLNPYAIANAMKKKGAKPHYKDKRGKPQKKKA